MENPNNTKAEIRDNIRTLVDVVNTTKGIDDAKELVKESIDKMRELVKQLQ